MVNQVRQQIWFFYCNVGSTAFIFQISPLCCGYPINTGSTSKVRWQIFPLTVSTVQWNPWSINSHKDFCFYILAYNLLEDCCVIYLPKLKFLKVRENSNLLEDVGEDMASNLAHIFTYNKVWWCLYVKLLHWYDHRCQLEIHNLRKPTCLTKKYPWNLTVVTLIMWNITSGIRNIIRSISWILLYLVGNKIYYMMSISPIQYQL